MYYSIIKNAIITAVLILLFALFVYLLIPKKANAGEFANSGSNVMPLTPQENLCFMKAASMYQVPVAILKSIAKVESGYNPYALNVEGVSYLPSNPEQSWAIIRANYNKSIDIGIMQVNTYWFRKLNIPYWYGLNTCYSIMLGAYVLRQKINRYGNNWFGIAAYHSASPYRNNRYAWMLWNNLKRQGG
ncbi:MAG: lytic transglycosylase domain-containing protein [Candidatus Micrarchaeaceae archaeon]